MIDRSIALARRITLLELFVAACSTSVAPTPAPIPTPAPTVIEAIPLPTSSPEASIDPNGLPPTTTAGWWGDPDNPSECMALGAYRVGSAFKPFGDCFGMPIEGPREVTLDAGQDMDIHMTINSDGAPPIYPLPEPADPLIVRGWLIFDQATMTYRGLLPGTTRLLSRGSCLRSDPLPRRPIPSPQGDCVLLVVHVRDIPTRCVELPEDVCRAVAAQAVLRGWGQDPGQRIAGWVVQPDHFIGGWDCGDGVAKVTFTYTDPDSEVTVQVGQLQPAASGPPRYVVCTY